MRTNWSRGIRLLFLSVAIPLVAGAAQAQTIADVPREETFVIIHQTEAPVYRNVGVANPFLFSNQDMKASVLYMFEPLFYYNSNRDELIPWLAESFEYGDDFKTVTVHLRDGVKWSDGVPYTAADVVFTYQMLMNNGRDKKDLRLAGEIADATASVEAIDDLTVKFTLAKPDPRYAFKYLINHFDIGTTVVPAHIWSTVEDPGSFTNFDVEKGWPVTTGPWKIVRFTDSQVMLDRRDDYWGAETGFTDLPEMKRIIALPGNADDRRAQLVTANQVDVTFGLQSSALIRSVLRQNPKITTFSGAEKPFGNKDWFPTAIYFNHLNPKWADPRVRRAINHFINREQIIDVVDEGAGEPSFSPWPGFGSLQPFIDEVTPIADKYGIGVFDPAAGDALMMEAGYAKNADGLWAKDGQVLSATLDTIGALVPVGPIITQQLKNAGFDVTFRSTPDSRSIMFDGRYDLALFGHLGSISDPYATLALYTCKAQRPEGTPSIAMARWCNPEYDTFVDQIAKLEPGNPEIRGLVAQAMEIWMREAVEVPIQESYHRIPMNQTYWTNWPSVEDPYMQPAFWFVSGQFGYVLQQLKRAE